LSGVDTGESDLFGRSVFVADGMAFMGASRHSSEQGAVYVFERAADGWHQSAKLVASDPRPTTRLGRSLSYADGTLAVGGNEAVYVFVRSGGEWIEEARLTPSDGDGVENFGWDVALSGNRLLVGAPGMWRGPDGSAYVFVREGSNWREEAKLTPSEMASDDGAFGYSVSLHEGTAVVGAVEDDGVVHRSGAAYVFARLEGSWREPTKLVAPDAESRDEFGWSVAVLGTTILVGAPGAGSGSVYVFGRSGSNWGHRARLTSSAGRFGEDVAASGESALIGASGSAHLFAHGVDGWTETAALTRAGVGAGEDFGYAVSLSSATALVGAPGLPPPTGGPVVRGYAYPYDLTGAPVGRAPSPTSVDGADESAEVDAGVDSGLSLAARTFCDTYEMRCGFGPTDHFSDEATCRDYYDGAGASCILCVTTHVSGAATDPEGHCAAAAGASVCASMGCASP
jgi:hypothetical protein